MCYVYSVSGQIIAPRVLSVSKNKYKSLFNRNNIDQVKCARYLYLNYFCTDVNHCCPHISRN